LALQNGTALTISRELIDRKLAAQERAVKNGFCSESAALAIRKWLSELAEASSIEAVRSVEAKGAKVYWATWRGLGVMFPRQDLQRVPEHWRTFGSRISSLTASPRRATNPVNAILNYLYALLEVQARLAAAKLGLFLGFSMESVAGHVVQCSEAITSLDEDLRGQNLTSCELHLLGILICFSSFFELGLFFDHPLLPFIFFQ
jgi:CRISPR/Cas system-associated endonuclease Cas1